MSQSILLVYCALYLFQQYHYNNGIAYITQTTERCRYKLA